MKLILVVFLFLFNSAKVNQPVRDKLDWLEINLVSEKIQNESRPVIIDLYTNWCYWCKVMDKKTYSNKKVIDYINNHFYAVKLDAETKGVVKWKNKDYQYNNNYKVNEFAMYVTSGQLSFPSTIIIPDMNSAPIAIAGFMEPKEIESILKYFGEGAYKKQNFQEYQSKFKSTW
ncbi:MAG: DUF255 domain-containing protein [Ginsengibacter sp.]